MRFEPTLLAILDISGYTHFIRQRATTLPHAEEIITSLLESSLDGAEQPLQLNKLEGDAALLHAAPGDDPGATAARVLAGIGSAFDHFDARLRSLSAARSHCQCGACANIAALSLKALLHVGDVAHKQVRGLQELAGEPVILIHRLLKNRVASPRYVLMTADFHALLREPSDDWPVAEEHPDGFDPVAVRVLLRTSAPLLTSQAHD